MIRAAGAMASTRVAVCDPPLLTMTSSKGTTGFAAAIPFIHSSSRSIRFQVTTRIDTIGSGIEAGQSPQLADPPHHGDAVATGRFGRRPPIEIAHEGFQLAPKRRLV